jgi:hypothetical protein
MPASPASDNPAPLAFRPWFKANGLALAVVAVLGLLLYAPFLFSGKALFASDQLGAPAWRFYFESLRHGTVPLWLPFGLGGMPLLDANIGDALYPPFLLVGMLFPIKTFIGWMFVIHTVIAGWCAYFLVSRFFGLNRLLSTALACAYMLNTNFISHVHAGHTGKFYIMAWIPLSLFFLLRSLGSRADWRHALGFALTIAIFLSCGHPQLTYYVLMGYFMVWAWKAGWLIKEKRMPALIWTTGRFWIPILLGVGLAFFQLYPPKEWTKNYGLRGDETGGKTTYEHATSWSMHPEEAASLMVPEFGGLNEKYWGRNPFKLNSEYPGLAVWFLALLGLVLFRREKRGWYWLWTGVGLMAIIFGLGAHTPLFHLFYSFVPGIRTFRAPSMMLFWLATALLVMSADTLSRLESATESKRRGWSKRTLQIGLGAAGVLLVAGVVPDMTFGIWNSVFGGEAWQNLANQEAAKSAFGGGAIKNALLLAALVYATWRWLLKESFPLRFGWVLLAVVLVDLYWTDSRFIETYDKDRFISGQPSFEVLKADTTRYRVFGLPGSYERWQAQYYEIETADGWTDNEYRLYREFRGGDYVQNPNFMAGLSQNQDGTVSGSHFLDLLNVKYLAFRMPGEGIFRLAPNRSMLPRAWFAGAWESRPDAEILERMKDPAFPADARVIVSTATPLPAGFPAEGAGAPGAAASAAAASGDTAAADSSRLAALATTAAAPAGTVSETRHGYNRMAYKVENAGRGILFLSELYFPHWRVTVDGKETPLLRVDYAFRGVALEPGRHEVALEYHSPWLKKGFAVSGLSFLLLLGGVAGLRMRERRENRGT